MSYPSGGANSTWCMDCNRHSSRCECNPTQHIYLVEYRLCVEHNSHPALCLERVRCVAFDEHLAVSKVTNWALTTDFIWWTEHDETVLHRVPIGPRDVTIMSVQRYADNVGELLRACPLPEIFPHEV